MGIYGNKIKETEQLNEGILGAAAIIAGSAISTIVAIPFAVLVSLIFALSSAFKTIKEKKFDKIISKNPEVSKSIKKFAECCQKQILKDTSKYNKYIYKNSIKINGKNFTKDKISIPIIEFDNVLTPGDLYKAVAPYIYEELKDDEDYINDYKDYLGIDDDEDFDIGKYKEDIIKDIADNPNYFECGYDEFLKDGKNAVENIIKKDYPELISAFDSLNKSVDNINKFISGNLNSKGIHLNCSEVNLSYFLENHFADKNATVDLIIEYQDYSQLKLPKNTKEELDKIKNN